MKINITMFILDRGICWILCRKETGGAYFRKEIIEHQNKKLKVSGDTPKPQVEEIDKKDDKENNPCEEEQLVHPYEISLKDKRYANTFSNSSFLWRYFGKDNLLCEF